MSPPPVKVYYEHNHVIIDNGLLKLTLSNPQGCIAGIQYKSLDNLLELMPDESRRGYWDLDWNSTGGHGTFDTIKGTHFKVILENEHQIEVSFTRSWNPSLEGKYAPLAIDIRFIVLRGSSGFYSYAIFEHKKEWPAFNLGVLTLTFKLRKDKFHYMAIGENRRRYMPSGEDRNEHRSRELAYKEARLLIHPIEPQFKGEVDDKYQYSSEDQHIHVHGWINTDKDNSVGFWVITPSYEFKSCGPLKQNLTSHVGPTSLAVFLSPHYGGTDLVVKFKAGEAWKKVFGPVFIYLNSPSSSSSDAHHVSLWEDAKKQSRTEIESWPYSFPASIDFAKSNHRGKVSGIFYVQERYVGVESKHAKGGYVGLAPAGEAGSWQKECKDYQFWTRTDENGYFSIKNVRVGTYNLYGWVPGFIGDYKYHAFLTIAPGSHTNVGRIYYKPPRNGPTLWEIGIPNRSAREFFVPHPDPRYINKLYVNHPDRFRQYGLWERYTELYPHHDLVYTIGTSDYKRDWFFAHVSRRKDEKTLVPTTWKIKFKLSKVDRRNMYMLRVAIASATYAELQIRVNDEHGPILFSSGLIGRDNAVARHGIHGLYWLFNIHVPGVKLKKEENVFFFTQPRTNTIFQSLMYDYIRLEGPPPL